MIVIRECAFFDLADIFTDAADGDLGQFGIAFGELGFEIGKDAKQVVTQKDLAIRPDTGADADGRYLKLL